MIEIIPNWHPAFVHFPIAFSTASVFFFLIANLFREKPWTAQCMITGRWMLWGAAISACIAAIFGWYAYNSVDHDDAGHRAMTLHAYWALAALAALVMVAAWDFRAAHKATATSLGLLIPLFVVWLLVINTAWHGGEVVFRHGLGVLSLPQAEHTGHTHEHIENMQSDAAHGHGDVAVGAEHGHDPEAESPPHSSNHDAMAPTSTGHTHAPGAAPHND